MATYLVTGGAGLIGSHIVDELVRRGERVLVLDNLSMHRSRCWGDESTSGKLSGTVLVLQSEGTGQTLAGLAQ